MKIKDVHKLVDISAANIRYYEKEGLLRPKRNQDNNYREYTQEDVERLEEIKKFRLLGISVANIQKLYEGQTTVDEVMKQRLAELAEEKRNLELVKNVCENAIERHIDMGNLEELQIDEKSEDWQRRLAVIMQEDTVQEVISQRQFNFHVALMLTWGFALCGVISWVFLRSMIQIGVSFRPSENVTPDGIVLNEKFPWILLLSGAILVIMMIAVMWSSRMIVQLIAFHLAVVAESFFFLMVFAMQDMIGDIGCKSMPIVWGLVTVFILVLYGLYNIRHTFFQKIRYTLITWVGFVLVVTAVFLMIYGMQGPVLVPIVVTSFIGICVSLQWAHSNSDTRSYNRFYAASCSARMVNFIGVLFAGLGQYGAGNVFRR